MAEPGASAPPRSVTSVYPALAALAVALGVLAWAQSYSETARRFPGVVAGVMAILALIDLWSRVNLPGRKAVAAFWGADFDRREMTHDPSPRAELALLGWVAGCFAGMALIGILPAAPLFCVLFIRLRSRRPLAQALMAGAVVLGFEYAVFEWLLDYELYRGLLFTEGGLHRW